MLTKQTQTKHAKPLLVCGENRYFYSEPTIAACPNEPKESNGYDAGGQTD